MNHSDREALKICKHRLDRACGSCVDDGVHVGIIVGCLLSLVITALAEINTKEELKQFLSDRVDDIVQ